MQSIADVFAIVEADQASGRRITHITISPEFWGMILMSVCEVWTTVSGFPEHERKAPATPMNLMGVPLEIDELQTEDWVAWKRSKVYQQ